MIFRLRQKPSKRDVAWSESELLNSVQTHRLNSKEGEIKNSNYLRINNTNMDPGEVASKIKDRFNL